MMEQIARLTAIEAVRQVKARYFRGVDDGDGHLVRSILAPDCILDYVGCCKDPVTGIDHMPAMNLVIRGRDQWPLGEPVAERAVTVHQGNDPDITIQSETHAMAIWSFTDRMFLPPGGPFLQLTGWGRYHDTYENLGDGWKLKTTRIVRLRVETTIA